MKTKKIKIYFSTLTISFALVQNASAAFFPSEGTLTPEEQHGKELCENEINAENPQIKSYCESAKSKSKGGDAQTLAMVLYAAASGICVAECITPAALSGGTACTISGMGVMVGEVATSAALGADTGTVVQGLLAGGGGTAITAAMKFLDPDESADQIASANESISKIEIDSTTGKAKDPSKQGELEQAQRKRDAEQSKKNSKDRKVACTAAAINAAQSVLRGVNGQKSYDSSKEDYRNAFEIFSKANPIEAAKMQSPDGSSNKSQMGGSASATQKAPGRNDGDPTVNEKKSPGDLAQMAATAGQGPLLNHLQKLSGRSPEELFARAMAGQDPVMVAAEMASNGNQQIAGAGAGLSNAGNVIAAEMADKLNALELKSGMSKYAYQSSGGHGSSGSGSGGGGMDFGSLMAQLMPKKEDLRSPAAAASAATKASPIKDGLHASNRSLFEIVNQRYLSVGPKFLGGQNIAQEAKPASLLPSNLYLKQK